METSGRQLLGGAGRRAGQLIQVRPTSRRRRPSGEPPPLPRRLESTGLGWLVATLVMVGLSLFVFAANRTTLGMYVTVVDNRIVQWIAQRRMGGLTSVVAVLSRDGLTLLVNSLFWLAVIGSLLAKRPRHTLIFFGSVIVFLAGIEQLALLLQRPRPFGVGILGTWGGFAMPSESIGSLAATLVGALYILVPQGRLRQAGKWIVGGTVAIFAGARLYAGVDAPSDILFGAALGTTVPLIAFRFLAPNDVFPVVYRSRRTRGAHLDVGGRRGEAIQRAMADQLGIPVLGVEPFGQTWSAGSTPLRIRINSDLNAYVFAKLYASSHMRNDRLYKLARSLRYGGLEDEKPFNSVRRLVEREQYALLLMQEAGIPVPRPCGTVELTPEREYLLVTEFLEASKEISEVEIDDAIIDQCLDIVRKLWDAGLAHRDIKPANLLVHDGQVRLIDAFLTQVHPSPWRQAIDLANMMAVLALRTDAVRVYQRARRVFSQEEISEALAVKQGSIMPAQLRQMLRAHDTDLRGQFRALLPKSPPRIPIQRWSVRRIGSLLVALTAAVLLTYALVRLSPGPLDDSHSAGTVTAPTCHNAAPLWLMAQSVPSASHVPCIGPLPGGWKIGAAEVKNGESLISLNSDRAGDRALVVRFSAACDTSGSSHVRSDKGDDKGRYERVHDLSEGYRGSRYYVFAGGCVTFAFDLAALSPAPYIEQAGGAVLFISRDDLGTLLHRRSQGRLQLGVKES